MNNNNNNIPNYENIILNYLRQSNKTQKQVVIEAYQTLSLRVKSKSKLLKSIIIELLKQRRFHSSDKDDLDLDLYLILGFNSPSIEMLYLSQNELKTKLLNQHKNESSKSVKLDLIIASIMSNLTRHLRDTTTLEKRKELRSLFKKEGFSNSIDDECQICDDYRNCDKGLGYCNKCPNKPISFCGDSGSDIDCCMLNNNNGKGNSNNIGDNNIGDNNLGDNNIGVDNIVDNDYNLYENQINKNDTQDIERMNTMEDIYAEYIDVDPNFVLGEDGKLYYHDEYSNVLTEVNFKNNPWKLSDIEYFLKKYKLTKDELKKYLIPKLQDDNTNNLNNNESNDILQQNDEKILINDVDNDVDNDDVDDVDVDDIDDIDDNEEDEDDVDEVDSEELLFIEKKKKVRKKASTFLKIIFFTTILLILFYLAVSIYNSFKKSNRSATRLKTNLNRSNRNTNIKLNNSTRQRISNNQI